MYFAYQICGKLWHSKHHNTNMGSKGEVMILTSQTLNAVKVLRHNRKSKITLKLTRLTVEVGMTLPLIVTYPMDNLGILKYKSHSQTRQ